MKSTTCYLELCEECDQPICGCECHWSVPDPGMIDQPTDDEGMPF